MAKSILLPLDYSDPKSWEKALPVAKEQAGFYDASLTVLTVVPEVLHLPNLPADYGDGAAAHVKTKVSAQLADQGHGDLTVEVRQGSVYREILKYAHTEKIEMIVMASAEGDFPNYEIGPNLARVVRNAHCSVLVVRD